MPAVALETPRQSRSVLKLSLGITLVVVTMLIGVIFFIGAPLADATVCTWTAGAGGNWTSPTSWQQPGCNNTYPGAASGDTATFSFGAPINVDAPIPNSVILNVTGFGVSFAIPTSSALTIEQSSTLGSGGSAININGGALTINGPGTLSSQTPITLGAAGAGGTLTLIGNLSFSGATFAFDSGTINGPGTLTVPVGNIWSFSGAGPMTISQATVDDFGTINFTSVGQSLAINSGGHVKVESGAFFNLGGDDPILSDGLGGASIDILSLGTLTKSGGTSTAIASMVNNGGTISVPSTGQSLTLSGGGTHTGTFLFGSGGSAISFDGTHAFNPGTTWTAPVGATFHVLGGTTTINTALSVSDFALDGGTVNGSGSLTESATATKNTSANASIQIPFNINGPLTVAGGLLDLSGSGATATAPITVNSGETLSFSAGGNFLSPGASLNGAGALSNYKLTGTAFLNVNTPITLTNLTFTQDGATTGGSVLLPNSGFTIGSGATDNWQGGQIFGGSTTVNGGSLLIDTSLAGVELNGGSFLNISAGSTATWTAGTNSFAMNQGSQINVNGLFDIQTAGTLDSIGSIGGTAIGGRRHPSALVSPPNTINVNNGGLFQKSANAGTMIVVPDLFNNLGGTVSATAGFLALSGNDPVTHNGTFNAAPGTVIDFSNGVQTIAAGVFSGTGIYKVHGATLDLTLATISVANFDLAAGTLEGTGTVGTGNLVTTSSFVWDGGDMIGGGTTTVQSGTATISGTNGPMNLVRPLVVSAGATATYSTPQTFTIADPGGAITNNGTFTLASAQPVALSGTPPAGTYLFTNAAGATLNGNGTINVPVTNDGNLNPGTSPGFMTINNAYNQTANGVLNVDLDGPATPGTTYDVLNVNGAVTLAGALNTITGYTPLNGDTFSPLLFTSRPGSTDFTTKNLTFPGGVYSATYTGTSLQLAAVVQADVAVTVAATPTPSVTAGGTVTYTVTVVNNGPGSITADQVNLTLTNGTISSVAGGSFTCTNTATTVTCTGGGLAPASPVSFTVVATAPANAGTMTMGATVSSSGATETNPANNTATVTTTVNASADVSVAKTLSGSLVAGGSVTYDLTVSNSGPSTATNLTLADPTPAGLTFVSTSAPCGVLPCNLGTYAPTTSRTYTVTFSVPSNASGSVTNTATANASETDPNAADNTSSVTTAILQQADLTVTKTGPSTANPGSNVTYTITVTNNGPSDAAGVSVSDPAPSRLSFVSATGACKSFLCAIGTMTAGQTTSVQATYTVLTGPTTTIINTATATATTPDPNSANNSGSASTSTGCPTAAPSGLSPADGLTNVPINGMLSWSDVGAASYTVYLDVQVPNACTKFFGSTTATSINYSGLQPGTTYQWHVDAVTPGCSVKSTACITFTTAGSGCPSTPPTLTSPLNTNVTGDVTFSWSSVTGAKDYQLFVNNKLITTTNATTFGPFTVSSGGPVNWYVVAEFDPPCASLTSATGTFNGCDTSGTTIPSIVGQADSAQTYDLLYDAVSGASKYEVDEATNPEFSNPSTQTTTGTQLRFQHAVSQPTAFYYRVRAFFDCANGFGPNSVTVRVVLAPVTSPFNPNVSVPSGNDIPVKIIVHIPGFPDGTFPFTASLDEHQPWLIRVDPSSGTLPPEGIDLTVFANPGGLPNGTHTGTVIVTVTTSAGGAIVNNGVTTVSAPVSISLVTPITPKPSGTPQANSMIIPSTGHLDGINSRWASDVRVLNTASQTARYQLTFTPDDVTQGVKQTVITADPGATIALDDVIKTWYGVGSLGESSNGSLEIRPLDSPAKGSPSGNDTTPSVSFTTVASSRTYNAASTSNAGTLGEFIPAIPFSNFVGRALDNAHAAQVLGLQQIAQSDAMRTNVGVMEASGQPASVLISVFDSSGKRLLDFPMSLAGGQHAQLNSFLSQNKISLPDGRIEVQVTGGEGKITAYASVIDNKSGDPILISGVPLRQSSSNNFVLPGVADLNTGTAAWRTDMRIFNPTSTPQFTTLTFYPQNGGGEPQVTSMTINPGEVKRLDNTLNSVFGLSNTGGAIHVTTTSPQPLVVSGRTYNLASNGGTYGQLTTAVTSTDAIGKGDRPLQILQAEDSVRERTNVGVFEVTGKPATVEVTLFVPDSKISPSTQIPLPANGFIQVPVIQSFGLSNVYNARISLRVVDGDGRIGAYGSVIDQVTQDPTYIPAQQ